MSEICVFWESIGNDGWAKVNATHHQPHKLDAEQKARGLVINPSNPPALRAGWYPSLWVNPDLGTYEHRVTVDREFYIPAGEFLASLPVATRVQAKALVATDPILKDFLELLDMMVFDNASKGLHPGSGVVEAGLGYLVHLELMTPAQMQALITPYEG